MNNKESIPDSIESKGSSLAFYALLIFTGFLYLSPQAYYRFLGPLRIQKVCVSFAILAHILYSYRNNKPIIRLDKATKLCFAILALALISIPFSSWPGGSFELLTGTYLKVIIVFLMLPVVLISTERLKTMFWVVIICSVILALLGIKAYLDGAFIAANRIGGARGGMTANPNDLALTLTLSIPFLLSFLKIYNRPLIKIVCISSLAILISAIICTFSRGAFITLVTVYAIFCLKTYRKNAFKILLATIILTILFFMIAPEGYTDRLASIFDFSLDPTGSAYARKHSILLTIAFIKKHPLVGNGFGMNILVMADQANYWSTVHNVYLQVASEIGIPAMVIYIVLLIGLIKKMRSIQFNLTDTLSQEIQTLAQSLEIALIAFAVAAFFHPVAYHFHFYYLAGFAMAIKRITLKINTQYSKPSVSQVIAQ